MKRLLRDEVQLNQILNGIANGITVQDPAGKLVFVNKAAARLLNCASPEEAVAKGGAAILKDFEYFNEAGDPLSVMELPGRKALAGEEESAMIVGYRSRNHKGVRWTSLKAMPVLDENGKVILAVNVMQDVTALKETEHRLKEANERIAGLLEEVLAPRT